MMELKTLLNDDRAVSPVIGVILMVAITVILAAVIGTFVLGLGSNVGNNAPQATFEYKYTPGASSGYSQSDAGESVLITHQGGDAIEKTNIEVSVGGSTASTGTIKITRPFASTITAGNATRLNETGTDSGPLASGNDVNIIWSSPSGGDSSIISSSTVPSS